MLRDIATATRIESIENIRLTASTRTTVAQYLEEWLETSVTPMKRPRTLESYRDTCNRYIVPVIGGIPLGFAQPLVLLGLLSLPVLWWLLRLVPPRPRRQKLGPEKLLLDILPKEETPARTPWWLTLLRLTLAELDEQIADTQAKLDSMNQAGEIESLRLQMAMDRVSKMMTTLSNLLKKLSENAASVVQNLK